MASSTSTRASLNALRARLTAPATIVIQHLDRLFDLRLGGFKPLQAGVLHVHQAATEPGNQNDRAEEGTGAHVGLLAASPRLFFFGKVCSSSRIGSSLTWQILIVFGGSSSPVVWSLAGPANKVNDLKTVICLIGCGSTPLA